MRKLWMTSFFALAVLMTLLVTVAALAEIFMKVPKGFFPATIVFGLVLVVAQFTFAPYILRRILKIGWTEPSTVSPEFADWYQRTASELKIGNPKFGIIESGMPNAFTFGRFVKDARVVVTRGLVQSLTEPELRAVVAHEFGHIRNRDFVAMTVVQALVMVTYYAARMLLRNSNHHAKIVGVAAYGLYWVAELGALAFSRVREFMADQVSAETTGDPNALASALVKIGYGLARIKSETEEAARAAAKRTPGKPREKKAKVTTPAFGAGALGAWGICAATSYDAVAGWSGPTGRPTAEGFRRASAWELKNAWARYGELMSTHPLIVRRVKALGELSRGAKAYEVGQFTRPNWVRFAKEWIIYMFPTVAAVTAWLAYILRGHTHTIGLIGSAGAFCAVLSAALMIRMFLVYPRREFKPAQIADLLADTECSHVSPIPCTLRGRFVTRAEGGLWWSANLVLQDETGLLVAQRKLMVPAWMTMWGWLRARWFVSDHEVIVTGWYRRYSHPTLELNTVESAESGVAFKSPYWIRSMIMLGLGFVASLILVFVANR